MNDDFYDDLYDEEPLTREEHDDTLGEEEFTPLTRDDYDIDDDEEVSTDVTQHMLLSYLNANHELWVRCAGVIKEEYFTPDMAQVVTMIKDFELHHRQMPNKLMVLADTGITLDTPDDAKNEVVADNIADRVEEFCRHKAAAAFMEESYDQMQEDKSKATMTYMVSEMKRISEIAIQQDLGYEAHDDVVELLQVAEESDALPTGFDLLDLALNGGVTNPSYNLVSAASGQGKSIFLQNAAINYSRQGYNVVYISLELPEFMIEKRLAAMMTDTDINSIYKSIDSVVTQIKRNRHKEGKIRIKRMSMTGTTLADIRSYVSELESASGEKWEHIMLDYPDLMAPMKPGIRTDNIHVKDQVISEEIFEWTHERGSTKTIWGASQQVKGAKDEKDARQSGVSGGVGKVHTCDNLVILKRSKEDIQAGRCWGFIEKGRNGGTGLRIPFDWDINSQRMTSNETLVDLYDEANMPSNNDSKSDKSSTKKRRFETDPMVSAHKRNNSPTAVKTSATVSMIKKKLSVGKA